MSSGFYKQLRKEVSELLPPKFLDFLPRTYKKIGHIAFVRFRSEIQEYKLEISEKILKILSSSGILTIAEITQGISGMFRTPSIKVLVGDQRTETVHKELGCQFKLNVTDLMFSTGNHGERTRLINWINFLKTNEKITFPIHILDMFACVGNLSLPLVMNIKGINIIALEMNTQAIHYLEETIKLNKIPSENTYSFIEGDNRLISPKKWADIVIMGYFDIDKSHLIPALHAFRGKNNWLVIHEIIKMNETSAVVKTLKELLDNVEFTNYYLKEIKSFKIKSVAQSTTHWVFECKIIVKY